MQSSEGGGPTTPLPARRFIAGPGPTRDGGGGGTRAVRHVRKRPRLACLEEPLQRHLYELIVRQLHYDGYTDAAAAVSASTGAVVPALTLGNYRSASVAPARDTSLYATTDGVGDRLLRLVSNGIALESTQALELRTFLAREVVERHVASSKLYLPFHLSSHGSVGKTVLSLRERFTSSSLGGVVRAVEFSPDGSLVACGGTNGLAAIFSLATLGDLTALEEVRQERQWGRLHGGMPPADAPGGGGPQRGGRLHVAEGEAGGGSGSGPRATDAATLASIRASNNASNVITELSEVRRFHEHEHSVEVVRFHPAQPYLLTGDQTGALYLRDYSQPRAAVRLTHHDAFPIRGACFHPSSGDAVSTTGGVAGAEYVLYVTDHVAPRMLHVETQSVLLPLAYSAAASAGVAVGGAGFAASAGGGTLNTLPHTAALCGVDVGRDGRCFATASMDGSFALHDAVSGRTVLRAMAAHSGVPVTSVAFSRTGNVLLTSGMDSTARLWDLRRFRHSWAADTAVAGGSRTRLPDARGDPEAAEADGVVPAAKAPADAPRAAAAPPSAGGSGWASTGSITELMSFGEPEKSTYRSMTARFNSHESHVWCHDASLYAIRSHCVVTGDVAQAVVVAQHPQRGFACAPFTNALVSGADDCRLRLWAPMLLPV